MSDVMTCMPFGQLVHWVLNEKKNKDTVFGLHKSYVADGKNTQTIFKRHLETPIGPAAGPNSQLAQNIVASYYAGSRFFELKTVQEMDGPDLAKCVNKPCILADDECYNCEWSTELYVWQAYEEYVKSWFLLHLIAKEFGLGSMDGFQFNISVGYNLDDIKKEKTDTFINDMMEAKDNKVFKECKAWLLDNIDLFKNFTKDDVENIPSNICNSVTLSTLHGCPPEEIEKIASYLLDEKGLNTFIKCNPTLLGYEFARKTMDDMGYDYIAFGDFHFKDDLQWEDAIPMLTRLMEKAEGKGLEFGVKITNTFPVDVKENELPSEEMYMSGKSLFPLSISLAAKLSREFNGKLRIAYSGGADYFNIERIVSCGIWPVTVATTILKPGGYNRLVQIADLLNKNAYKAWNGIDVDALNKVATDAVTDKHHLKAVKEIPSRKSTAEVPLLDCYTAPCQDGCPIHQDITKYVSLASKGDYKSALETILDRNPLPFITGNICAHPCMTKCTRNFYEENINIRDTKLQSARNAFDDILKDLKPSDGSGKSVAIVGGGPAGIACANYLLRTGCKVSLYEREANLGGTVANVIPTFRIDPKEIAKDASMIEKLGCEIHLNTNIDSIEELKKNNDAVVIAVGAEGPGMINIEGASPMNAIEFLRAFNKTNGEVDLGEKVAVIGGGNTAMDVARAAKRNKGVKNVSLVYRRTRRFMPADAEELELAIEDGVDFKNLLSPKSYANGVLTCEEMELSEERDASGRRKVKANGKTVDVKADTIILAVGEKVDTKFYESLGLKVDDKGNAVTNNDNNESSIAGVYVIGDGLKGPSIIVNAMADAMKTAQAITGSNIVSINKPNSTNKDCFDKKGILVESSSNITEGDRCLNCNTVCENCVDVCPNRANISIDVDGMEMAQVIHVDYMCNECGNCKSFCPYASAPYLDKFTLFANEDDMANSKNQGFCVLDKASQKCKVRLAGKESVCECKDNNSPIYEGLRRLMSSVIENYSYLLETK